MIGRIRELEAKVAELESKLLSPPERLMHDMILASTGHASAMDKMQERAEAAEAKARRLEEALRGLMTGLCWCSEWQNHNPTMMVGSHTIPCAEARQALQREPESEKT